MAIKVEPAPESDLLTIAQLSIESSRRAVEKLIESIPLADHFALGVLGPILAGLRSAEQAIETIGQSHRV